MATQSNVLESETVGVPASSSSVRVGAQAAAVGLVGNIAIFALASAAGVTFALRQSTGGTQIEINIFSVIIATLVSVLIGSAVYALLRSHRAGLTALSVAGVIVGLASAGLPLSMVGDSAARYSLAAMHVLTGVVFALVVRRSRH